MAYSVEWWQKTSGRTTAPHRGSGSVPNEYVTVGLRDEAEERARMLKRLGELGRDEGVMVTRLWHQSPAGQS